MALETDVVTVPFAGGLSLKADPHQVPPTRVLSLVNGQFDAPGRIGRRNGFVSTNHGAALTSADALYEYRGETLTRAAVDKIRSLLGYNSALGQWTNHGSMLAVDPSKETIVADQNTQTLADAAVNGDYLCVAWEDSSGGVRYQVRHTDGGVVVANGLVNSSAVCPRVVATGNYFLIFHVKTVSAKRNLYFSAIATATPSSISSTTKVGDDSTVITPDVYDVCISQDYGLPFIVWATASVPKATSLNASLAVQTIVSVPVPAGTSGDDWDALSIFSGPLNEIFVGVWDSVATKLSLSVGSNSLTWSVSATTLATLGPSYELKALAGAAYDEDGDFTLAYTLHTPDASNSFDFVRLTQYKEYGGTESSTVDFYSVGLASKPWYGPGDLPYFLGVHESDLQSTYFLMADAGSAKAVARLLPGTAGKIPTKPFPAAVVGVADSSGAIYGDCQIAILEQNRIVSVAGELTPVTGVSLLTIDQIAPPMSAVFGRAMQLSGGQPRTWDGNSLSELGFNLYPEDLTSSLEYTQIALVKPAGVTASFSTVAGALEDGTYYYKVTAVNGCGETESSTQTSAIVTLADGSVDIEWQPVVGATGYNVYGRTNGSEKFIAYVDGLETTSYHDSGLITPDATRAAPTTNTSGSAYSLPLSPPDDVALNASPDAPGTELDAVAANAPTFIDEETSVAGGSYNLDPGNYMWKIRAYFSTPNGTQYGPFSAYGPYSGSGVLVTAPGGEVTIGWTAVPGAEGYEVWGRTTEGPTWGLLDSVATTTFTDGSNFTPDTGVNHPATGLDAGTYYYGFSWSTAYGEAAPFDVQPLAVGALGRVVLSWGEVTDATGYKIWRGAAEDSLELLAELDAETLEWVDHGDHTPDGDPIAETTHGGSLPASTLYRYKVTAVTDYGESLPCDEVTLSLTAEGGINVSWDAVTGASGYRIYRSDPTIAGLGRIVDELTLGPRLLTYTDQGDEPNESLQPPAEDTTDVTDRAYQYVACYEATDANGLIQRSAPSEPLQQYLLNEIDSTNTITVTMPSLRITDRSNVQVVLYRTTQNGSVFYRVGSVANTNEYDTVEIEDGSEDVDIEGNEQLYTTGNVLENIYPGACVLPALHGGRLFVVDALDRNRIWYSKATTVGAPVEFSDMLQIAMDERGGPVTAISSLDSRLVVFKADRIFVSASGGLDALGNGDNFSDMTLLPGDTGCLDSGSVVTTTQGVFFRSQRGIYLLDRGLTLQYVGADIESLLSGETVAAALAVPTKHQVRFLLARDETILVYDWLVGQWSEWMLPHAAVTTAVVGSKYSALGTDGKIYQETPAVWADDGAFIPLTVKTAWIKLSDLTRWQRTRNVTLLGTRGSGDIEITVNIRNDYQESDPYMQTQVIDTYDFDTSGAGPLDTLVSLANQHGSSVQVEITDDVSPQGNGDIDAGMTLSALAFEVGLERSKHRLIPATRRY